jgi:7,8-dihydro-6-hydroxymethylpterin dimethyltransferase
VAIVRRLAGRGLRATLLTNGIKASRDLLAELCEAGLTDVAFHVDTTQQRPGHAGERQLNALRLEYIERARGLPLSVFFNTTVHAGNFDDVPMLAAFFVAHADVVRFASFQLQAETGRGVLGARVEQIDNDGLARRLREGVGVADLKFNVLAAGHHDCNRSAVLLVANGRAHDAFADSAFVQRFMRETAHLLPARDQAAAAPFGWLRTSLSCSTPPHSIRSTAVPGYTARSFIACQPYRGRRCVPTASSRRHRL